MDPFSREKSSAPWHNPRRNRLGGQPISSGIALLGAVILWGFGQFKLNLPIFSVGVVGLLISIVQSLIG